MRRWLWLIAIGIRTLAAAALLFGPWTDQPDELEGWDSSRFQEIHDASGRPWVDEPVEYPPGTVAIIELIARDSVVGTHQVLIVLSLAVDLGIAALLARTDRNARGDAGLVYLLLGTAMVPMGLLRFDLWATACTAIALVVLARRPSSGRVSGITLFALAVTAGAAIKVAPAILIAVAVASRRRAEAAGALVLGGLVGAGWLIWAGTGALDQVLSLRAVTGWHLESVPGSVLALATDEHPRLEADAYRIGKLRDDLVLVGRLATAATIVWLGVVTHRTRELPSAPAAMTLGSTAALLLFAPLLSPQFLLWLTPAAALLWASGDRRPVWLTGIAIALTAVTSATFGPPRLDHPLAATALLIRDGLLIAIIVVCGQVDRRTR